MLNRAYSWLDIRAVDDEKRTIEGIATTPEQARDGDIVETAGIQFKLPLPFLLGHRHDCPLGNVVAATVGKDGIKVRIEVAPAGVSEDIDAAWRKIKAGIIRGLSIGWRTIQELYDKEIAGFRILKSEWLELSAVPVPADPNALMTSVRSADEAILAALGRPTNRDPRRTPNRAGVSAHPQGITMTNKEHIAGLENRRAANVARMGEISTKIASEGRSMDEAEAQEFDGLQTDVETIDRDLVRLRKLQAQSNAAPTTTVTPNAGTDPAAAAAARQPATGAAATAVRQQTSGRVYVKGVDLPKGTGFTRYAIALHFANGDRARAAEIFEANRVWMDQTPEVLTALRTTVPVGTTTTAGWAAELAPVQNLASEFVELLRPRTLLGRIPGFRNVPFNVLIPRQTAGTEGDWVGEGARKPVGRLTTDNIEFKFTKIAKIVAITEELARFSNPSAEARVRQDLIEGIQVRMDRTFADPAVTAIAGIRPASIFNGADTAGSSAATIAGVIADVKAAMATFTAAELPVDQIVVLTTPTLAVALSLMRTTLDAPAFPGMTPSGGNLLGFPVYTSSLVPSGYVEFFIPGEVLLADDGQADVSVSNQATLIMDDGNSPSNTASVNLWQENKIGIRAERFVNWLKRRDDSTYYVTGANYGS